MTNTGITITFSLRATRGRTISAQVLKLSETLRTLFLVRHSITQVKLIYLADQLSLKFYFSDQHLNREPNSLIVEDKSSVLSFRKSTAERTEPEEATV